MLTKYGALYVQITVAATIIHNVMTSEIWRRRMNGFHC